MSSPLKSFHGRVSALLPAMFAALCVFAIPAAAQDQPPPKVELFVGYSFFLPGGDVHGQLPGGLLPLSSRMESNPRGAGVSGTYNFNRWFGLTLDASTNWGSQETTLVRRIDDAAFANVSFGPKFTYRTKHFAPFFEVLVGDHRLMPDSFHDIDKIGFMIGGGLDIKVYRHVALRVIRADYVYSNYRYGPPGVPETQVRGLRAETGLNFTFGGETSPVPPGAACSVQPSEIFAGEPVTATASGSNFNPKRTVSYNWSGTGVAVTGSNATTQVDTTGLRPGFYGVTANLSEGRRTASCSARFRVREPRPPVISCSADPGSVQTGGTSTITSNASSPSNRPLAYSYSATAGDISGNGATATLDTRGASPGRVTVTCNVSDDHTPPLSASATTTVYVEAPPPPAPEVKQLEARLDLHSIYFQTARPYADNPEGGLLESQEETLKTLAEDFKNYLNYKPDARLILGGYADPRGTVEYNLGLTQRRVDRTKNFLVEHGVPADHIDTQSHGKGDQLTADQIKDLIAQDPDLSPADRQQMLDNLPELVLANNRRVDVSLASGQQSTRRYPFNAKDYLALISTKGGTEKRVKP